MPKKRVASKKKLGGGKLTGDQIAVLLGEGTAALLSKNKAFKDEEARRWAWENNRDRLLYLRVDKDGGLRERNAYTRPEAWWEYEAPEPLQIIKNAEYYNIELRDGGENYNKKYAFLYELRPEHKGQFRKTAGQMNLPFKPEIEYETEKDYLIRLGLDTAWDREREREPLREYTEEEQRHIVEDFIKHITISEKSRLELRYEDHIKGRLPFHESETWPDYVRKYKGQASHLAEYAAGGKAALEAWKEVEAEIISKVNTEVLGEKKTAEARQAWEEKKKQKGIKGLED